MDIEGSLPPDEPATIFFTGQHETERNVAVSSSLLGKAQDLGYDFVTTPLTTVFFHQRVVSQLQDHLSNADTAELLLPLISPLSPQDSSLTPSASNSALMGVVSPWIDLTSADPIIAHASMQVLSMEVAFAAFCGISNVIIHGPPSGDRIMQYSRAVLEAMSLGPYVQVHVLLSMSGDFETDGGDTSSLVELARPAFNADLFEEPEENNEYRSWQLWDSIRSMCNYSQKISIGKHSHYCIFLSLHFPPHDCYRYSV